MNAFVAISEQSSAPVGAHGNGSIEHQELWLGDLRFSALQRQTMAVRVGQTHGNRRLQHMVFGKGLDLVGATTIPHIDIVQREEGNSPTPDATPAPPASADVTATVDPPQLPDQDEYTQIVNDEIQKTLEAFENIEITVPAIDPKPPAKSKKAATQDNPQPTPSTGGSGSTGDATTTSPTVVTVRAQYWINSDKRRAKRNRHLKKKANKALKKLFTSFPKNARLGKSSPEELRSSTQQAIDQGLIRGPGDSWPPGKADIEAWMGKVGLGVDCSGFVYQALTNATQALEGRGAQGMQNELTKSITSTGSGTLYKMGTKVKSPSELRPGDVMYLAPNPDVGHIRIITSVTSDEKSIEFTTVESAGSANGPAEVKWRYPDGSKFKKLQIYKSKWKSAGARDKKAKFSHHFAATPQPLEKND
jgi:cell wall-associated NlpC family hydrolase